MIEFFEKIKKEETGQSLIEILIALTIGAILIGAASSAVVTVLQSGTTSQRHQTSTVLAQDYTEKVRSFTSSDWHNLYNLEKTSSTLYHFQSSSSQTIAVQGREGVIDSDIRTGIQGYWPLDEASSTIAYDKSNNENIGTINNAIATSTDCKVGRCYSFDGSSSNIDAGSDASLEISGDLTLSAWIHPSSIPGSSDTGIAGTDMSAYQLTYNSDGNVWFYINSTSNNINASVPANEWHHVVGVWDGTTNSESMKLYVDGELSATSTSAQSSISGWSNFLIGREPGGNFFEGKIDDVRIYNRALSEDDINHFYNSAKFSRYFYVENVCRSDDSNYELAGVHPCDAGQTDDPSTQKVTVVVNWGDKGEFIVDNHITRWRNRTFPQTDWSGGSGVEGPFDEPPIYYSTSTDIKTSSDGSIKVEGI